MSAIVDDLSRRLTALEQEVSELRAIVAPPTDWSTAERGAELLRRAKASGPMVARISEKIVKDFGLDQIEPISAEQLQEMMLAEGVRPDENLLSSEIIRLRYGDDE